MDMRFNQINKALAHELKGQSATRLGKSKKLLTFAFFIFDVLLLLFASSSFLALSPRTSRGQTIIAKTSANIKAAASSLFPFYSSEGPKNILLLGAAGQGNDAPYLTDTIVLAMIKPDDSGTTLVSLPRDLWVKVPQSDSYTKINSLYILGKSNQNENYGLELIKQKVEQVTGQKIDNYLLIDLSVVKQIIDQVGGLNVLVRKDILDTQFPGPNHSFETFEIKAGWRYMDGETAAKYIRTRHSVAGDFDRMSRQQDVLFTLKQKITGLNPVLDLPKFLKILSDLNSNIKTDIPISQFPQFWQLAKNLSPDNINKIVIDNDVANPLVTTERLQLEGGEASIVKPRAGLENYSEIQNFININQ